MKLTVHSAYLDHLETSAVPDPQPTDPRWCRPKLQRSRWYDLFDVDDRLELFRGLWGIMNYLVEDPGTETVSGSGTESRSEGL